MTYKRWTDAEVRHLEALIAMGLKRREIVKHFSDMTEKRLTSKMANMGLKTAKNTDPFSRHNLIKYGLKIGCISQELSPEAKRAVRDKALRHRVTAAKAIDIMLRERLNA